MNPALSANRDTKGVKTVYFVRHGQSEGNIGDKYQTADEPLTDEGIRQAEVLAERCKKISFDALVSSTMERARQTAACIERATGHRAEYSDMFTERISPSSLRNGFRTDPQMAALAKRAWDSVVGLGPRVEDAENFDDLKTRAGKCFEYLENHSDSSILVVTHGNFLRMLVAFVLFDQDLTPDHFSSIARGLTTRNTGITMIELNPEPKYYEKRWSIIVWNDHAHLG